MTMINTSELCRLGAMPQSHDGDGWHDLERTHGRPALASAIVAACKKWGSPVPLSEVRARMSPFESTADTCEVDAALTGTHGTTTKTTPSETSAMTTTDTFHDTTLASLKACTASRGYVAGMIRVLSLDKNAPYRWLKTGRIPGEQVDSIAAYIAEHPTVATIATEPPLSRVKPAATQDNQTRVAPITDKPPGPLEPQIRATCATLADFLCEKNRAYGNSAGDPVGIFFKGDKHASLAVRIDDKLSRLARGSEYPGDDTIKDLAGYLVLWLALRGGAA